MYAQLGGSVLGLVAIGCDIALTRQEEVRYIWKKPCRKTFVRGIFILMRYLPIVIHGIDVVFASIWIYGAEQVQEERCMGILIFRFVAGYVMSLLLESVLMLRVFALYDRSRTISILLLLLLALRISVSIYTAQDHLLRFPEKTEFTSHCIARLDFEDARNPVLVFIYGELTVQLLILLLAMKRTIWDLRHFSHLLFSVLNRDGLVVFIAVGVTLITTGAGSMKAGLPSIIMFPLFIVLFSAAFRDATLFSTYRNWNPWVPTRTQTNPNDGRVI
ncbi:hypothetical protein BDP27DRAFT_462279 [Rhodocollybia butyracea]|uniref:DUF6533 domain-containing protein n=1 Tax=Rhodocollybia butyracea TaxID=206335 RepID=A0A9P5PT54_9AGAR|nr:hypothetical protein BDP27DRAFT_462279 [Rhodocollybia butyracea]